MFDGPPTQTLFSGGSTSRTLLDRIRLHDPEAWRRFVHLYGPVIYGWGQQMGLQSHDAADVSQEVFQAVASSIEKFRRDRPGDSFRRWLRTIAANKIRDHFRAQAKRASPDLAIDQIAAPDPDSLDGDPRLATALAQRALDLIQTEFETSTWQAFWACSVSGLTAPQVATDLGLTVAAVYKAKSRVLNRLRRELDGLME
ncbi:MAG: sigma-70 family RNA polymerase sigma factor [Planctomycetaceae bacterium]|nr:sigma-70 family RNA polymerase sigma factor [Planctomycetaceae bacterium]